MNFFQHIRQIMSHSLVATVLSFKLELIIFLNGMCCSESAYSCRNSVECKRYRILIDKCVKTKHSNLIIFVFNHEF